MSTNDSQKDELKCVNKQRDRLGCEAAANQQQVDEVGPDELLGDVMLLLGEVAQTLFAKFELLECNKIPRWPIYRNIEGNKSISMKF